MTTLTYDAKLIRLAMTCQAKQDARFCLNGILLSSSGDIVGTDAHRLACTKSDVKPESDTIVNIQGKLLKTDKTIAFDFDTKLATVSNGKKTRVLVFEVIDGKYPDHNRVIPDKSNAEPTAEIGLNANYLAALSFFGDYPVKRLTPLKMTMFGENSAVYVEPTDDSWPENTVMVIMPIRL